MRRHWRKTTIAVAGVALIASAVATSAAATSVPPDTSAPAGTEPAGTEPAATAPAGTEPAGTEPAGTGAAGTAPAGTEPAGTGPAGTAATGDLLVAYDERDTCGTDVNASNVAALEAPDERTFVLTLCNPDVTIPAKVAFSALGIIPSERLDDTEAQINGPIGTGPYAFETWERGSQIVMQANPDYWGDAPLSQTVVFQWNAEAAQRLVQLEAGTADGIDNVGTDDFQRIMDNPDLQLIEREPLNVFYLGFNVDVEPFNDVNVRRAVALALDKQRIVDNFYPGGSSAATQFIPPGMPGFDPEFVDFERNVEEAQALLAEAGYPDGFETDMSLRDVVRGYLPNPTQVATDIQAQLAEIGITVNIDVQESGTFIDNANGGNLSLHMLGWGADFPDPSNFYDFHFGEAASPQFGTGFPDIHERLTAATQTTDEETRFTLYHEVNQLLAEHIPMVPIAYGGSAVAYKAAVEGAHSSPLGNEAMSVMGVPEQDTFVWVQNGEPAGLWCADESDGESLRVCEQIVEPLLAYEIGGVESVPALAESWESNEDFTVWTFHLRDGVTFHDGSTFDAVDVVENYKVLWDAADPRHVGRTGDFVYPSTLLGGFLNPPPPAEE
jgi:ABC-type transport system substrate-binding protein